MDVYLTLDYELFLGSRSGSVQKCLLEPMDRLDRIALDHDARFTIFVDATYLLRIEELMGDHESLRKDYDAVVRNLRTLASHGHDLQLHLHPQWAFSTYDGEKWDLDTSHYKLSDLTETQASDLFTKGADLLERISGKRPVAFRAGGFSAQPTALTVGMLRTTGIRVDCSVYPGTAYNTPMQQYDYTDAPEGLIYNFDDDMCVARKDGEFKELPLTTCRVSPLFFWRLVLQRLTKQRRHRRIGDGESVKTAGSSILKRLTSFDRIHATIDESKISFLYDAFKSAKKRGDEVFCVIGHPKLATRYSLDNLPAVLNKMSKDGATFKTVSQIVDSD